MITLFSNSLYFSLLNVLYFYIQFYRFFIGNQKIKNKKIFRFFVYFFRFLFLNVLKIEHRTAVVFLSIFRTVIKMLYITQFISKEKIRRISRKKVNLNSICIPQNIHLRNVFEKNCPARKYRAIQGCTMRDVRGGLKYSGCQRGHITAIWLRFFLSCSFFVQFCMMLLQGEII